MEIASQLRAQAATSERNHRKQRMASRSEQNLFEFVGLRTPPRRTPTRQGLFLERFRQRVGGSVVTFMFWERRHHGSSIRSVRQVSMGKNLGRET